MRTILVQLTPLFLSIGLGLAVTTCNAMPSKPTVIITLPPHGGQFKEGDNVVVQSTASDPLGIARVELLVDGTLVHSTTPLTPNPTSFTVAQHWRAAPGEHVITVRAYNSAGVMSEPVAILISVASPPASPAPPTLSPSPPATVVPSPSVRVPTIVGDPYADRVVSFKPGNPVNPQFGNPQAVLGAPDFNLAALSGFLNLGIGGSVTVEFVDNLAVDGPGPDLEIFGDPDNDEEWIVEVSADCVTYKSFGKVRERVRLDLASVGLASARCVRLTDSGIPGGISPGTELDAVMALHSTAPGTVK